jgi:hypothetical protein
MTTASDQSIPVLPLVIDRQVIIADQIDATYRTLSRCIQSPEAVRLYAGALELSIEGYQHDSRKLHEIPEVRRFIQALHERFPYWIHFSAKTSSGLALIQLCLLENISTFRDGDQFQPGQALRDLQTLLMEQLRAAQLLYRRSGMTTDDFQELTLQLSVYMQRCAELF